MANGYLTKDQRDRLRRYREKLERDERSRPFLELPLPVPREAHREAEEEPVSTIIIIDMF